MDYGSVVNRFHVLSLVPTTISIQPLELPSYSKKPVLSPVPLPVLSPNPVNFRI
ncbi:hypothetical protein Misp06_00734 [Microbulbifer sp. NBRC 101763]